jgi:hypothetical protein
VEEVEQAEEEGGVVLESKVALNKKKRRKARGSDGKHHFGTTSHIFQGLLDITVEQSVWPPSSFRCAVSNRGVVPFDAGCAKAYTAD